MVDFTTGQRSVSMYRLSSRSRAAFLIAAILTLAFAAGASASVKSTSILTQAKLTKSGELFGIQHTSGFAFTLPQDQDFTVYEAKDAYGLRKLYLASSAGPIIEISAVVLDSFTPGALDAVAMSLYSDSSPMASGARFVSAEGIDGIRFIVRSKAATTSQVRIHTLLTDYRRAIIITAYTQETAISQAEAIVTSLMSALKLDDSWAKAAQ